MEPHKSLASEVFLYRGSLDYGPLKHFIIYLDQYSNELTKIGYYTKITRIRTVD